MLEMLAELARRLGPVAAAIVAVVGIIVGILIIAYPPLLSWIVGIALIVLSIGVLAAAISVSERPRL